MSQVKQLLDALLCEIYGVQRQQEIKKIERLCQSQSFLTNDTIKSTLGMTSSISNLMQHPHRLKALNERQLIDVCAILKVEITLMSHYLERVLVCRDRLLRHQEVLCGFVNAILHLEYLCLLQGYYDAHPKMHFSLSPPPPKADFTILTSNCNHTTTAQSFNKNMQAEKHNNNNNNNNINSYNNNNYALTEQRANVADDEQTIMATADEAASDYIQWLHAMKLVAHLPGGMPPEFRHKLWLSLADKYLKSKNIDWAKEEEKCFCEKWREDDEELGIQIVKDLHRTGSNLCTGPAGTVNQAKLKRILLGYARYNPEVGYCQGFNMLGALILQVMDKNEFESMKVMIYLVEGILPPGYFHGSMGGLQADMGVFRELMQTKLPRLAKHLQKLQGPIENAFEPPLTNVFTMQWFLTMFCTCLPMTCVLRVWDLVLIEGSDVLLRTALVLWSLLEDRVLSARTADDFYCKMGSFSSELLNGHLIDSNGLIEKVVKLGAIPDLQKLRDKHLYNIAPLRNKQGLQFYYDDDEPENDEESRLAVATVWGLPWGRRGSQDRQASKQPAPENKERLALDISLLKKQYDRLRERQKQAQLILTTACNTARQTTNPVLSGNQTMPVNHLLLGRQAIVSNRGKRLGAPSSFIPPARKPSLPAILHSNKSTDKQFKRGETLHWRDTDLGKRRRESLTWKEIKADRDGILHGDNSLSLESTKLRNRIGKSDSSSYSEESEVDKDSSTDTSLCDDDDLKSTEDHTHSSLENSPRRRPKTPNSRKKKTALPPSTVDLPIMQEVKKQRPKSWAPSRSEIPFVLMNMDSPVQSGDENFDFQPITVKDNREDSATESDRLTTDNLRADTDWFQLKYSSLAGDLAHFKANAITLHKLHDLEQTGDVSSEVGNVTLNLSDISLSPTVNTKTSDSIPILECNKTDDNHVIDTGVTNEYFERVNNIARPTNLELLYSLSEEDSIRNAFEENNIALQNNKPIKHSAEMTEVIHFAADDEDIEQNIHINNSIVHSIEFSEPLRNKAHNEDFKIDDSRPDLLRDTFNVEGAEKKFGEDNETELARKKASMERLNKKRRDPRRMTLTRSSTIDIEERFRALENSELFPKRNNNAIRTSPKRIPSTADLEARYNTLERQLSANSSISKDLNISEDVPIKPAGVQHIPSTQNLEERFNVLAKQMSSGESKSSASTNIPDKAQSNNRQEEAPTRHSKNTKSESDFVDTESTMLKNQSTDEMSNSDRQKEKPRLKKLPSTAELEDRFKSLERRLSAQNSSPLKSKKEPPDGSENSELPKETKQSEVNKQKRNQIIKEDTLSSLPSISSENKHETEEKAQTKKEEEENENQTFEQNDATEEKERSKSEKISEHNEKSKEKISNIEMQTPAKDEKHQESKNANNIIDKGEKQAKEGPKNQLQQHRDVIEDNIKTDDLKSKQQSVDGKIKTKASEMSSNQAKINRTESKTLPEGLKKSPPSTEELESRFNAMEKQLTLSRMESAECELKNPTTPCSDTEPAPEKKKSENTNGTEKEKQTKMKEHIKEQKLETQNSNDIKKEPRQSENEMLKSPVKKEEVNQIRHDESTCATQRRGSEPPSTEDLEKRYENLKRRMSSRTLPDRNLSYTHVTKLSQKSKILEQNIDDEKTQDDKVKDETSKHVPQEHDMETLPTTEDLESRFDALQLSASTKEKNITDSTNEPTQKSASEEHSETLEEQFTIPEAPPLPMSSTKEAFVINESTRSQQRALIEELQGKIKSPSDDGNLKPSSINPNRIARPIPPENIFIDGTSEAHAKNAFQLSENHELWHQKKIVRRFSDLPSRADLENRLQFLERQLYKKFERQRCASDSEVTSRKSVNALISKTVKNELPSTSKAVSNELEERVKALEKQLSENSLKLLESLKEQKAAAADIALSRQLSTETIDGTGKELVRYTHFGEVEESDSHKPLNIKIQIKMSLNNSGEQKLNASENLPTTEELQKRLEILEKQMRESMQPLFIRQVSDVSHSTQTETRRISQEETITETLNEVPQESPNLLDELEEVKNIQTSETDKQRVRKTTETKTEEENNLEIKQMTKTSAKSADTAICSAKEIVEADKKKTVEHTKIPEIKQTEEEINKTVTVDKQIDSKVVENKNQQENAEQDANLTSSTKYELDKTADIVLCEKSNRDDNTDKEKTCEAQQSEQVITESVATSEKIIIDASNVGNVDSNKNTLVLLMDNEPKAVKVRRLTRANTEELEGLFEALEKQLNDRNLVKGDNGKLIRASEKTQPDVEKLVQETQAISNLTKEIEEFTSTDKTEASKSKVKVKSKQEEEPYDWGPDPVKRHLKRRTVYLPSTKELEARFRSFERQIKFLEDVEKIDVEQRLNDIERKIKLQYSLSHEKDLNKFLELCEGKEPDSPIDAAPTKQNIKERSRSPKQTERTKHTPETSPARRKTRSPYTSPNRRGSPSPARSVKNSPYTSPQKSHINDENNIPSTEDLEYRFRALDLKRSKSKENLQKSRKDVSGKKQPIHPLEMLLDPSPDDSDIPTTGELEHRMRVLEEKNPVSRSSREYQSPDDGRRPLPTAQELEARVRALEEEHTFDFKTQKSFKEFNQKLKEAVSPSLSFEELKSREQSPKRSVQIIKPKSALRDSEYDNRSDEHVLRSTSPKTLRFSDDREEFDDIYPGGELRNYERTVGKSNAVLQTIEENSKILHRILQNTLTDSNRSIYDTLAAAGDLEARGAKLLRETSPLRRTGTHTGVPLRTDLNINDRLDSIKNTIKSIDHLCEEKPYHKERCQRYIDSLFTDSVHFSKKSSLEDLRRRDYGPSIRISDHSARGSDYVAGRFTGSADSIRSTSPLRAASPLHHRSNRELRRETSPRRRREEEREEHESRVRRENMLPNLYFLDNHSNVSRDHSLTQFHKVDRQLDTYKYDERQNLSASRSPLRSPYGSMEMRHNTTNTTTTGRTFTTTAISNRLDFENPVSSYRPSSNNLPGSESFRRFNNTPIYNPGKLEIRHTTVTSTFYDRVLTEKKIEKTLTPNRSPVISPSITSKSYTDLTPSVINTTKLNNLKSPTAALVPPTSGYANVNPVEANPIISCAANIPLAPQNTTPYSYTNIIQPTIPTNASFVSTLLPTLCADSTPNELRMRSCENIPAQVTTNNLPIVGPTTITTMQQNTLSSLPGYTLTSQTYNPSTYSGYTLASYTPICLATTNLGQPISTFTTVNSLNTSAISTGVYNPVMPFIMRQPPDAATITSLNVLDQSTSSTNIEGNLPKL